VGVDVGWAPVSSGCLGAYNLRCGLQGEGKRIARSVVGRCRYMSVDVGRAEVLFSGRLAGLAQRGES
jgi:hypothetical protein